MFRCLGFRVQGLGFGFRVGSGFWCLEGVFGPGNVNALWQSF